MTLRRAALCAVLAALPLSAHAQQAAPAPIETQALSELNGWTVSALSPAEGALPSDLWARSDPSFLTQLFSKLPDVYESPAALALARRVLLSGGEAPSGDAAAAMRGRFEALGKMGAADALSLMAAGARSALNDPAIAQFAAQAELARGQRADACARGRAPTFGETPPPFILRLRAYCAAVAGDRAAADLALELARAANAEDAWHTQATAAAGGAPGARPPTARYDNSLTTQLSLAAGLRPGPNPLANSSTLALIALARSTTAPQPFRAQAAALAYQRGALPLAEARTILRGTPAEITSALPPILAVLRQIDAAPGSLETASAVAALLQQANTPSDFAAAARLFKDDIANFEAAPDQGAALSFARAAIAAGDAALAHRLLDSARTAGVSEQALAPLDAALAAAEGVTNDRGRIVTQRRIDAGGASLARAAARDAAILIALGAPTDGAIQRFVLANPPQGGVSADPAALLAMEDAAARAALGEAALLAVIASGRGPASLDAPSLTRIIRTLRALGLAQEARRFAVEALLAGAPS